MQRGDVAEKRFLSRQAGRFGFALLLIQNLEAGRRGEVRGVHFTFGEQGVRDGCESHAENPLEPLEMVAVVEAFNAIVSGELGELRAADLLEDLVRFGDTA